MKIKQRPPRRGVLCRADLLSLGKAESLDKDAVIDTVRDLLKQGKKVSYFSQYPINPELFIGRLVLSMFSGCRWVRSETARKILPECNWAEIGIPERVKSKFAYQHFQTVIKRLIHNEVLPMSLSERAKIMRRIKAYSILKRTDHLVQKPQYTPLYIRYRYRRIIKQYKKVQQYKNRLLLYWQIPGFDNMKELINSDNPDVIIANYFENKRWHFMKITRPEGARDA